MFTLKAATAKMLSEIHAEAQAAGTVQVLHVRHWARRALTAEELEQLMDETDPERER